jgi:hypothetical protein
MKDLKRLLAVAAVCISVLPLQVRAQQAGAKTVTFQPVTELPYRVVPDFFKFPKGMIAGEASAVAVDSRAHIFLFQRTKRRDFLCPGRNRSRA